MSDCTDLPASLLAKARALRGATLMRCLVPRNQTLAQCWPLRLVHSNGDDLQFWSEARSVGGWREVGALDIDTYIEGDLIWAESEIATFRVGAVELLIADVQSLQVVSGIAIQSLEGTELLIVAGVSPGSLSVCMPGEPSACDPEWPIEDYRRVVVD
jgi:hypothetical protein